MSEHDELSPEEREQLDLYGTDACLNVVAKGSYAEITIKRDSMAWKLLIDEKNLTKLIWEAQQTLLAVRSNQI